MRLCIYGRGKGREFVERCLNSNICVSAYIDNYTSDEKDHTGIPIIKHKEIDTFEYDFIIVSLFEWREIYGKLLDSGISEDRIICFFCMEDADNKDYWNVLDPYKWRTELLWRFYKETALLTDNNIHYELYADKYKENKETPTVIDARLAIDLIVNDRKSLTRFGDGEFEIMAGRRRPVFQMPDKSLGDRLKCVLNSDDERILIAIADNYGKLDKYTDEAAVEIRRYLTPEIRDEHMKLLNPDRIYYNAYFSRPYIMYRNKKEARKRFDLIRKIWEGRNVIIVEGEHTRTGVGNDLLSNTESIKRVIVPDRDAFSRYEDILNKTREYGEDRLALLSVGPTATVLVYDLVLCGIQAVDIGQIDNEYEWFLMGTEKRCYIPGKTVSELSSKRESLDEGIDIEEMKKYEMQIAARIE